VIRSDSEGGEKPFKGEKAGLLEGFEEERGMYDWGGGGVGRGRRRVGVWNGKIGNLRALALGYVQRE
jgi:hypothetical protein